MVRSVMPSSALLVLRANTMMQIFNCFEPDCCRPFQVNAFSERVLPAGDFANIICPHCGATYEGDHSAIFLTHALSPEQEVALRQES